MQLDYSPLDLIIRSLASSSSHRYTQVLKARHFGWDAGIQEPRMANYSLGQTLAVKFEVSHPCDWIPASRPV